ncbi:MAG TPA: hypothetical protein VFF27_06475 [Bacteroidia bacterium]|jgi:hypothetical protein|nr:hypothetical protein [Bacteroidia bacterium]
MSSYFKKILTVFFTIGMISSASSQQLNYTLSKDFLWDIDNYYNNASENFQTFSKPYLYENVNQIKDSTAVFPRLLAGTKAEAFDKKPKKIQIEVYPLLNAGVTYVGDSSNYLAKDLGIGGMFMMNIGTKFSMNFKAFAGKSTYPDFMQSKIQMMHVVPGMDYAYRSNTDSLHPLYAYQYYSGYVSYSPNKIFNIQVGQDKQFFGDGYRSLFLSDVAAPYPFLKITTRVWHLTYINLYTIMKDATNPSGLKKDWLNKYATYHYLGWNATKRIQIGLFESIMWQGSDSNRYRGYDVNYLNPILFFRPTEYSLGSSDNAFAGFSFKIKLFKKQQLYGQLLLDEFLLSEIKAQNGWWANKYAFQGGLKSFDLFKIKHLNFQTEVNYVRPYTYSHGSVQQNYGHMNQPLAHPLGANFIESVSFLNYRYKRFFVEAKCTYAIYGEDSLGTDYGKNIFISYNKREKDYGNTTMQGIKTTLINASLRFAYMLDTKMNLKIELGVAERIEHTIVKTSQTPLLFLGIRTDLSNLYSDF